MADEERPTFATLLESYLESTGVGVTELARRLAGKGASKEKIEARRRPLQRYLKGDNIPQRRQRAKIIAALKLRADAFDAAFPPDGPRPTPRDQVAELRGLIDDLKQAIGDAEDPAAETIRGLLRELATKLAKVERATAANRRHLAELGTRVARLEDPHERPEALPTDQEASG